ncbi:P-loop NTPase fold protein [Flavobacterium sp. WC2430]|uniref:P-loop NTPase fold protein n=1 Tax=Flavobacterium sp. WC2430 TaxID=3234137 RepID=UPI00346695CD
MSQIQLKFLDNQPIGDDLFEGKSQEKIGSVVADIIKNKNFQIIGIDGAWGTGKSNLVKIIDNKLPDFKFFIYDVWGHQEDDQRKAILVELTEFISDKGNNIVSNKSKWKAKLKRLLAKEKEVTTINRPYLSIGFILSLVSIIYVPTVNTFIKDIPSDKEFHGLDPFIAKIIAILFPVILIVIIYSWKVGFQLFVKGNKWQSFKIAMQQTFQVYTNKQEEETKIETISENEPSVKDFRNWMKEIDTDLGDKKLVLVFDNFDRLPKKHILSIWSSIHIFFAEEKYNNIKVIIPFDRLHIQNAFKELNGSDGNYANDYINKTFNLVYRVSPPILSSWKVFFKERWKEAFTLVDESEFLKVILIYEVYRETITPREIIACINEIVSIKLLDSTIPDRYIALFVLNTDPILKDPLKAISNPLFLKGLTYLYGDDDNFQKYITALAYQIEPKDALEVVYIKQLKNSLINKNLEVFTEISKTNVFSKIIESVLSDIEDFDNPIFVLDTLSEDSKITEIEKQSLWNAIYLRSRNLKFEKFEIKESQKILVRHIEINKAEIWIKSVIKELMNHSNFDAVKFARMIDDFDKFLKENNVGLDVFELLKRSKTKEVDANLFIPLIADKKDKFTAYCITIPNDELNKYLIGLDIDALEKSNYIKFLKPHFNLDEFIKELSNKIQLNKTDKTKLSILYTRLKEISEKPLKAELTDVEVYTLFNQSTETENLYYDLLAMRMSKLNSFHSSYAPSFGTILNSDKEEIANKIAERIELYINYDKFLIGSEHFKQSILYKSVAKKIIAMDNDDSESETEDVLRNFESICTNIEIDAQLLLNGLDRWEYEGNKVEGSIEFPNILFQEAKKSDKSIAEIIIKNAFIYFANLDKEGWVQIFDNLNSKEFNLIKIISFNQWNSHSTEALKESLIKIINAGIHSDAKEWIDLITSFENVDIELINTFKDIRDVFYNNGALLNKDLFNFYIYYFLKYKILEDKPNDAFRTIFKVEFLDDPALLKILIENSAEIKSLMQKSNPSDVANLKQGIRDRSKNSELITDLAKKLDIRPLKKE